MVIAIIAILAALLLPVLATAKLKATQATCISNQKQLMLAFSMFSTENEDNIVGFGTMDGYIDPSKIPGGVNWNQVGLTSEQAMANLIKDLAAPSVDPLYKYAPNLGVIHCPGDTRFKFNAPGKGWAYDSYSKANNLSGDPAANYSGQGSSYTKLSSVLAVSSTFAFREDADPRGYNIGTWVVNWQLNTPTPAPYQHTQSFSWVDALPMYHGNVSTSSFVDAHVEPYSWGDGIVIKYGKQIAANDPAVISGGAFIPPQTAYTADYEYNYQGYRFPGWQQ